MQLHVQNRLITGSLEIGNLTKISTNIVCQLQLKTKTNTKKKKHTKTMGVSQKFCEKINKVPITWHVVIDNVINFVLKTHIIQYGRSWPNMVI